MFCSDRLDWKLFDLNCCLGQIKSQKLRYNSNVLNISTIYDLFVLTFCEASLAMKFNLINENLINHCKMHRISMIRYVISWEVTQLLVFFVSLKNSSESVYN